MRETLLAYANVMCARSIYNDRNIRKHFEGYRGKRNLFLRDWEHEGCHND